MKIPKKVRKQAKKAVRLAESPAVRQFAAAALGAAAENKRRTRARPAEGSNGQTPPPRTSVRIDGDKLADAIRTAALDGFSRFLAGFEEGLRQASAPVVEAEPEAVAEADKASEPSGESPAAARRSPGRRATGP